ncbi:aspartate--tRNA ligase [Malassezia cuniculi]|uniref:Probable aspartate--tRNA ligase, cytoplasmic n=1 Tax=Malassezia cuniculi TaxID=948313 RepID=A0AAF0ETK6_9BASI|nr:aspartate--tRNA ligase [Malassezia cuniculi]
MPTTSQSSDGGSNSGGSSPLAPLQRSRTLFSNLFSRRMRLRSGTSSSRSSSQSTLLDRDERREKREQEKYEFALQVQLRRRLSEEAAAQNETPEQRQHYGRFGLYNIEHTPHNAIDEIARADLLAENDPTAGGLVGQERTLRARIHVTREMGASFAFVVLRSHRSTLQGVLREDDNVTSHMLNWTKRLPSESLVTVHGIVQLPPEPVTGCSISHLELRLSQVHLISENIETLPFSVYVAERSNHMHLEDHPELEDDYPEASSPQTSLSSRHSVASAHGPPVITQRTRLRNRLIDLRTPTTQAIFRVQSKVCSAFRSYLEERDFLEIHTPKLQGGASESGSSVFQLGYFGRKAFLAQSPQLYKQMCITSDFGRVYEIGPVFRAENSNTPRHLTEYTGLDLEMEVNHYYDAMFLIDGMLKHIFATLRDRCGPEIEYIREQYPSTEFKWLDETLVLPFGDGVEMLRASGFREEDGSEPDPFEDLSTPAEQRLGALVRERFGTDYYILDKFPVSARPFYALSDEHDNRRTNSFDIFVRGQEICTGGQRIHSYELLSHRINELGIDRNGLQEYLDAFRLGAPPHAGCGIGLERFVMLYLNLDDIRLASMFYRDPKSFAERNVHVLRHTDASTAPPPWRDSFGEHELQPLEKLIANYGDSSNTAWLDGRFEVWRERNCGAAVGFAARRGYALIVGNPLCDRSQISMVIGQFLAYLSQRHLKPVWLMVGEHVEECLSSNYGWCSLTCTADQRIVDIRKNDARHDPEVQRKIRHAKKEGVSIQEFSLNEKVSGKLQEEVDKRIQDWLSSRKGAQARLTQVQPWTDQEHRRYYFARDADGQLCCMVVLAQLGSEFGFQVKWAISFPDAPSGAIEYTIMHALDTVAGSPITFGTAATSRVTAVHGLSSVAFRVLSSVYNNFAEKLHLLNKGDFREKLGAVNDPTYICYPKHGLSMLGVRNLIDFFRDYCRPYVVSDPNDTYVAVVARSNYQAIVDGGIELRTHSFGDYKFTPNAVYSRVDDAAGTEWDYVLVATKALDNVATAEMVAPVVKPTTAVVIIQNGIAIEEPFRARFPDSPIISAVAIVSSEMIAPNVLKQNRWTRLDIGPYVNISGTPATPEEEMLVAAGDEACKRLSAIFAEAGISDAEVHDVRELQFVRWHKLMINGILNPSGVLSGCRAGADMLSDEPLRAFIYAGMNEVKAAGERVLGAQMPESFASAERIIASIERNKGGRSSMVQDWEAGRQLELDAILRLPLEVAQKHGAEMPRVQSLYALLQSYPDGPGAQSSSSASSGKRTLSRKTEHSVIERRRREKINDRLVCLQRTVPACRDKAVELLRRRSPDDEDIDERISSEMVLEKLCIITHAVEYIEELQTQLEAYRARGAGSPMPVERKACTHKAAGESDSEESSSAAEASQAETPETPEARKTTPHEGSIASQPPNTCVDPPPYDTIQHDTRHARPHGPIPPIQVHMHAPFAPVPYYVTTPIYYVNAEPHIGHLHSNVLADVLCRYSALRHNGYSPGTRPQGAPPVRPLLATGTDEHGLKIQRAAEARGEAPADLCSRVSQRFRALADASAMDYTTFTRTSDARHVATATHFWRAIADKGFIYVGRHEGWYAVSDEAFYPESQVRQVTLPSGETYHEAIESGQRVEWTAEDNYKFRLSDMQGPLVEWLEANPEVIQPRGMYDRILAEVKSGLADLSVSRPRSRLHWGVPVPGDPSHTMYVWIEALANYLTAVGYPHTTHAWPADVHVVGKDIVRFHAVYWPALLMAAGLPLPRQIVAHAHWTVERMKMSKSKGNSVDPFAAIDEFGVDAVRFFLMRVGGNVATDADYSSTMLAEFQRKYLQGQLGNLLSRVLAPKIQSRLAPLAVDGRLAQPDVSDTFHDSLRGLPALFDRHMSRLEISKALAAAFEVVAAANERVQRAAPWAADTPLTQVHAAVYDSVETLRAVGTLLQPFMPAPMSRLLDVLHVPREERSSWDSFVEQDQLRLRTEIPLRTEPGKIAPLFPRL